jgi:DNA polymerase-3 subunit beta
VIEAKRTLPILSHLLLEAKENTISISGTDLDVSIQTTLDGDVKNEGRVAVSGKKLYEIARELPDTSIDLRWREPQNLEILCAKSVFRLKGAAAEEFPAFPEIAEGTGITVSTEILRGIIPKVLFAVSTDQTRPTLTGALLQITENDLRIVATDGHRLSLVKTSLDPAKDQDMLEAIIPRKALVELGKMLKDESGEVRLIPSPSGPGAVVRREDFLGALRRTSTIAGDRATPTVLDLRGGRLLISCTNVDLGEAREEISMDYQGAEVTVGFNAKYLAHSRSIVACPIRTGERGGV